MQERKTGTTVVAIRTKEGIVIASDKRVSWGYLVYSKEGEKITQITDNIVIAAAGVYADLQFLSKILSANLKLKELRSGKKVTAREAAYFLSTMMYSRRLLPYLVEVIVAGKDNGCFGIYTLDPAGSIIEEKKFIATGSGMMFALGVLEAEYNENLSLEAAKELARKAVYTAIQRDMASGDGIEIVSITDKGIERELIKLSNSESKTN